MKKEIGFLIVLMMSSVGFATRSGSEWRGNQSDFGEKVSLGSQNTAAQQAQNSNLCYARGVTAADLGRLNAWYKTESDKLTSQFNARIPYAGTTSETSADDLNGLELRSRQNYRNQMDVLYRCYLKTYYTWVIPCS